MSTPVKKLLSGPRWWAPKGRGPWCTAPLVWLPLDEYSKLHHYVTQASAKKTHATYRSKAGSGTAVVSRATNVKKTSWEKESFCETTTSCVRSASAPNSVPTIAINNTKINIK